ncbi:MAG: CBS domain-containing protein, partial [Deltaproteobacteria bacterium]|nr:CBS domain-containing protein [Deltaproteobacteria bacterium]
SRSDVLGERPNSEPSAADDKLAIDVIVNEPISVAAELPLVDAAKLMVHYSIHRVFVTDREQLQGVLSTRDLMVAVRDSRLRRPISDFVTSPVFTVGAYEPLSAANDMLSRARISGLVVTDLGMPVGIYTQREALAALSQPDSAAVEGAMNAAIACTSPALPVFRAASQAVAMKVHRVIAIDSGELIGMMSGLDFARAYADPQT